MTRDELLNPYKRDQRARKYLRSKEKLPTNGNIRSAIAFAFLTIAVIIILLAL